MVAQMMPSPALVLCLIVAIRTISVGWWPPRYHFQKVRHDLLYSPLYCTFLLPDIDPREMKTYVYTKNHIRRFTEALFKVAPDWKQPKRPITEWITSSSIVTQWDNTQQWIKRNKILRHATRCGWTSYVSCWVKEARHKSTCAVRFRLV